MRRHVVLTASMASPQSLINGLVLGLFQDCLGDLHILGSGFAVFDDGPSGAVKIPSLKTPSAKNYGTPSFSRQASKMYVALLLHRVRRLRWRQLVASYSHLLYAMMFAEV